MLAFIDETGDHNLMRIDTEYPLFGLGALLIEENEYQKMDLAVQALKTKYFNTPDNFILHSSELKRPIHKRSDVRNKIMIDATVRSNFYSDFEQNIILPFNFKLIFCFIRKKQMVSIYKYPADPYYFSFENVLNRILKYGGIKNSIFAEKRGEVLNTELIAEYERLTKVGIHSYPGRKVKACTELTLVSKKENINGLQVIDLVLASITRAALGKKSKMVGNDCNPDLLRQKLACRVTIFPNK